MINSISKNNVIAGPFAHVFAQKFIIVKGTIGSQLENTCIRAMADTINSYWNERYFTNCTIKNDFEISEKDIAGSNLVLLGNYSSNLLLNKIQGKIPLKISDTDIQISSNKKEGDRLCFYMIYPNPLNKNKYIAIIGYNNPNYISLGAERETFDDVSNYGWYDYKIWKPNNIMNTILSGYFSRNWELQ